MGFCCFFSIKNQAQSQHDSLQVFEAEEFLATAKINAAAPYSEELAKQALDVFRSHNYEEGIVEALHFLGDLNFQHKEIDKALNYLLEAEARTNKSLKNCYEVQQAMFESLGDLFFSQRMFPNAVHYYRKIKPVKGRELYIQERIADGFLQDLQYDSAEVQYKSLIRSYEQLGDRNKLINLNQKLANAFENADFRTQSKAVYYYSYIETLVEQGGSLRDKAVMYNNLGNRLMKTGEYAKALSYFKKSELQCKFLDCDFLNILYANYGACLHNIGDSNGGLSYMLKAVALLDKNTQQNEIAVLEQLISRTYFSINDVYNSLTHNKIAINYGLRSSNIDILITAYEHAANLHFELYEYETAYEYYKKFSSLVEARNVKEKVREQNLTQQKILLERSEKEHRSLLLLQQLKDLELQQTNLEKQRLEAINKNLALAAQTERDKVALLSEKEKLNEAELRSKALEALKAQQELRLAAQNLYAAQKDREIRDLKIKEEIEHSRQLEDSLQRASEIKQLESSKKLAELEIERQKDFQTAAYGLGLLGLVILGLLAGGYLFSRRTNLKLNKQNRRIELQNKAIAEARERSDELLRNILPDEIAKELKESGTAAPKKHEAVTVLFTDFVNFTHISTDMDAAELIEELNDCFRAFDDICDKYDIEKIKTIGDAYMCAAGIPTALPDHAIRAANAAFEMLDFIEKRKNAATPYKLYKMRLGLHSGPVVAGVVGKNKFAYDIWGDTVNTAARMEEFGEVEKVNVSKATAELLRPHFRIIERGTTEVSGKGKIELFFVEKQ